MHLQCDIYAELFYFNKSVNYYDDYKLMELMIEKGPLGQVIYDIIVCEVFKNGYYLAIPIDLLANKIVKIIGNRWVPNKQIVMQVIQYCADIGLFDKDLLQQNVITSVELQEIYANITVRRQFQGGKYWLIGLIENEENKQPVIDVHKNTINVTQIDNNVVEIDNNVGKNTTKKRKVKESKVKNNINTVAEKENETEEIILLGEFENVKLTKKEINKLVNDYGKEASKEAVEFLSMYIADKGYSSKSKTHNLALRRWVFDAVGEQNKRKQKNMQSQNTSNSNPFLEMLEEELNK